MKDYGERSTLDSGDFHSRLIPITLADAKSVVHRHPAESQRFAFAVQAGELHFAQSGFSIR